MTAVEDLTPRRKRALWRASHRGIKEMDLLVGGYAARHLDTMSVSDINVFEEILEIPDQDLLRWATKLDPVPADQDSPLLRRVLGLN
jgi:antitoxin CptB